MQLHRDFVPSLFSTLPLRLYSAARWPMRCSHLPHDQEITSAEALFRPYLQHDGHVHVECLRSRAPYTWPDGQYHYMSGFNKKVQRGMVNNELFTSILLQLHERLIRATRNAQTDRKDSLDFVISCEAGCEASVGMVCIMEAVLKKCGWTTVSKWHLHLRGCSWDTSVPNWCCTCSECSTERKPDEYVVSSAFQQWRAVCD